MRRPAWYATDPSAPSHNVIYNGRATVEGDVRAVGKMIAALLPNTGAFASPVVRSRVEGVALRCESLNDLRDTLETLEKLATSPLPRAAVPIASGPVPRPMAATTPSTSGIPPPMFGESPRSISPALTVQTGPAPTRGVPMLLCEQSDRPLIPQGGGGLIPVDVRNDGDATLLIRLVATQHAWVNARPMALPVVIAPGASARLGFVVSAARLAPGEYRSEIYLSSNAFGPQAEDLRTGWFKHTFEIRVRVAAAGGRW